MFVLKAILVSSVRRAQVGIKGFLKIQLTHVSSATVMVCPQTVILTRVCASDAQDTPLETTAKHASLVTMAILREGSLVFHVDAYL